MSDTIQFAYTALRSFSWIPYIPQLPQNVFPWWVEVQNDHQPQSPFYIYDYPLQCDLNIISFVFLSTLFLSTEGLMGMAIVGGAVLGLAGLVGAGMALAKK